MLSTIRKAKRKRERNENQSANKLTYISIDHDTRLCLATVTQLLEDSTRDNMSVRIAIRTHKSALSLLPFPKKRWEATRQFS